MIVLTYYYQQRFGREQIKTECGSKLSGHKCHSIRYWCHRFASLTFVPTSAALVWVLTSIFQLEYDVGSHFLIRMLLMKVLYHHNENCLQVLLPLHLHSLQFWLLPAASATSHAFPCVPDFTSLFSLSSFILRLPNKCLEGTTNIKRDIPVFILHNTEMTAFHFRSVFKFHNKVMGETKIQRVYN